MRASAILSVLLATAVVSAARTVSPIFIQPITPPETPPSLLAEVSYNAAELATSEVSSYEAPEIPDGTALVRIGVYDAAAARWTSSTSVISVNNFGKGYSPHFILSVDPAAANGRDQVLGVVCRGVKVDAGYTRDFGPQVVVVATQQGKQPELNKPVVLSPEGKKVVQEEKTLFQKYWWLLAVGVFVLVSAGGDGK
ncbi:hypothetical protein B0H63DRAFT_521700 [Podospora didyma]|uniref:Cyclin-dependent protein kinase regulator pho80 n=1 Tax=Podospora didyma TaxID=330526 RepID=A0AAE0U1L2_9PEZI|nr:hypothetical protein B0H63DRAFT_521700 [Podospora didyma]